MEVLQSLCVAHSHTRPYNTHAHNNKRLKRLLKKHLKTFQVTHVVGHARHPRSWKLEYQHIKGSLDSTARPYLKKLQRKETSKPPNWEGMLLRSVASPKIA